MQYAMVMMYIYDIKLCHISVKLILFKYSYTTSEDFCIVVNWQLQASLAINITIVAPVKKKARTFQTLFWMFN